jgi:hypothetical protein
LVGKIGEVPVRTPACRNQAGLSAAAGKHRRRLAAAASAKPNPVKGVSAWLQVDATRRTFWINVAACDNKESFVTRLGQGFGEDELMTFSESGDKSKRMKTVGEANWPPACRRGCVISKKSHRPSGGMMKNAIQPTTLFSLDSVKNIS